MTLANQVPIEGKRRASQAERRTKTVPWLVGPLALATFFAFQPSTAWAQPVVINPGFEADATPPSPGYGTITGWTPGGGLIDGFGINEANGAFADNGSIPEGTRVAFIQDNGTLSQVVSGFTVGEPYWLAYRENARGLCCGGRVATLSVRIGNQTVVAVHEVPIVGASNPYPLVTSGRFVSTAGNLTVTFAKGGTGDSTVLIDDVRLFTRQSINLEISLANGAVPALHLEGIPGRLATLEFKDSLAPGTEWEFLTSFILSGGSGVYVDHSAPSVANRNYRMFQMP